MVSPRERRHLPWIPPGPEKTGCGLAGYAGFADPRTDCRLPAGHQTVALADPAGLAGPVGLGSAGLGSVGLGSAALVGRLVGPVEPAALAALAAPVILADPVDPDVP